MSVTLANGLPTLVWTAVPGQTYQAQYATDLAVATWADLGPPATAVGESMSITDTTANQRRFYRIILMAQ